MEKFETAADEIHDFNLRFANSSANSGLKCPNLSSNVVERTEFMELLQTCGNTELNKVLMVFSTLCAEMNHLSRLGLQEFVDSLALYGEGRHEDTNSGVEYKEMAKLVPVLYDLLCYVNRCFEVAQNLTRQLEALFSTWKNQKNQPNKPSVDVDGIRFDMVFECLGRLAVTLINIDEILVANTVLKRDFVNYKRIVELASRDVTKFDLPESNTSQVQTLFAVINKLERDLIDGEGFLKRLVDSMTGASLNGSISKNLQIADQFLAFVKVSIMEFESEPNRLRDEKRWLAINTLFVIYVWMFRKDDKKMLKSILDAQKRTNLLIVHLRGNVSVLPDRILTNHLPKSMNDKKQTDAINVQRDNLMKQTNLSRDLKQVNYTLANWLINFENLISLNQESANLVNLLTRQNKIMEDGLELAWQVAFLVKNFVFLHLNARKAMSKADLISVCRLINALKAIQLAFERKKGQILLIVSTFAQYNSLIALNSLSQMKKRLTADVRKYSEKKLDTISAVILASNCFHGPILTEPRQILASLCLAMIIQSMNEAESAKILPAFNRLEKCGQHWENLEFFTSSELLYFNRANFGIYFSHVHENDLANVRELRYFFFALNDCVKFVQNGSKFDDARSALFSKRFKEETFEQFKVEYLDKFCTDFETELRLQTHLELKLDDQSPFKRKMADFATPISCEPFRMFDRFISIRCAVQDHLSQMSYNLTTIALHDWKTYETMLTLANSRFGLDFVKTQLPTQSLEQGLDVLELTRTIHLFVSRYLYNLNNQMFIERSSENKHLNVLNIRHVGNSIQTHGFGVLNTAVNFTYQFLRKRFELFSQFLFEEHIKSRLLKDIRSFKESKANKFPFERADKFVKGIRKLGLTTDGLSRLDQFRVLVSEIGNALGFVRMLRSGALHCSSISIDFVPELDDLEDVNFESMTKEQGFEDNELLIAGSNLDKVLSALNRNFSEATDYFKLLVDVFAKTFRDEKNFHLKNFYVSLPALTLNFVEHSIISKEKMNRKNKSGAHFTDDGFAMGVAYILRLLDQTADFDGLHWASAVREKVTLEKNAAIKAKNTISATNSGVEENLTQTTGLTLKRLDVMLAEFELLNYNLTSCRILFRENQ